MTAWIIAIGRMLGLGTSAGLRPSLTLAVIGIMSNTEWGAHVNSAFSFLHHWLAICILIVLALLEASFDKIVKLDRLQDRLLAPYRLAGGAVAGAATIPFGWKGIVLGAALGLFASWFAQYTKHVTRPKSVPSDAVVTLLSLGEDVATFLGSVLTLTVPYIGYAAPATTTAIYLRTGQRRRAKYRRLRRQAAAGRMQRRMPLHVRHPAGLFDEATRDGEPSWREEEGQPPPSPGPPSSPEAPPDAPDAGRRPVSLGSSAGDDDA
jgi:uncharacterized membrane protein